jgi:hypothetical protein
MNELEFAYYSRFIGKVLKDGVWEHLVLGVNAENKTFITLDFNNHNRNYIPFERFSQCEQYYGIDLETYLEYVLENWDKHISEMDLDTEELLRIISTNIIEQIRGTK